MAKTDEQTKAYISALLREREHYRRYDNKDRLEEVEAELKKVGYQAKPPAKRAERLSKKG